MVSLKQKRKIFKKNDLEEKIRIKIKIKKTYFSVCEIPVDLLRLDHEVDHLPDGKLKVHLTEVENPPQILGGNQKMNEVFFSP